MLTTSEEKSKLNFIQVIHPYWFIFMGVLAVSSSSVIIKFAAAPPLVTAFYRMLFTVGLFTPCVIQKVRNKEWRGLTTKQLAVSVLSGIFLALHFAAWITSLEYTTITSSTVLVTLQPLFVMLGGFWLFGETVGWQAFSGAILSIAGGVILGYGDFALGGDALWGDCLALAGALFVACYLLIGRNVRKQVDWLPYVYTVYCSAAVMLWLGAWMARQPLTGYSFATWGWLLALAIVPNVLGHSVFNWALKYVNAAVVSVSILGEPVGATILAFIIWQQLPTAVQLAGGMLIISGVAIFVLASRGKEQESKSALN